MQLLFTNLIKRVTLPIRRAPSFATRILTIQLHPQVFKKIYTVLCFISEKKMANVNIFPLLFLSI